MTELAFPSLVSSPDLPYDEEVEAALLGALLRNNRLYDSIAGRIREEHFYQPLHQRIFSALKASLDRGQTADHVTLKRFFSDSSSEEAREADYLLELTTNPVAVADAGHYAGLLEDFHIRRELARIGEETCADARSHKTDLSGLEQLELSESKLFGLASYGEGEKRIEPIKDSAVRALEMIEQASKRKGRIPGVTTGLKDVDGILGGLHPSDLLILAGRPSMGKTALALSIACNAAEAFKTVTDEAGHKHNEGAKTLVFSLEMSSEQLASRILSSQTQISSDRLRRGDIKGREFTRLAEAAETMARMPLHIDDTPALTIYNLRQRARRHQRQFGLHLIIIDYLQLLQVSYGKPMENRVQEIALITRSLKALAKELNVPVLALSQLSRAVEARDPPVPQLSDLRDSGTIEQDSDVVGFIYREEYYLERKSPERKPTESEEQFLERCSNHNQRLTETRNKARLIVGKNRHGPVGIIDLFFNPDLTRFSDLEKQHTEATY